MAGTLRRGGQAGGWRRVLRKGPEMKFSGEIMKRDAQRVQRETLREDLEGS